MYNPELLLEEYEKLAHGKAKISAIYEAIKQADENNDVPFQFYFRISLCKESGFYGDCLDEIVVFPQLLSLIDKYPNEPIAHYDMDYKNSMEHILWVYKWFLEDCIDYYQVSKADCEKFFEDFKQKSLAVGYGLHTYYSIIYDYYKQFDKERRDECFRLFMSTPRDRNSNCLACEKNKIVNHYLEKGDLRNAHLAAIDLESGKVSCGNGASWIRLQKHYMNYYIRNKEFDKAQQCINKIKTHRNARTESDRSREELLCYSYIDIAKALRMYKANWKKWFTERNPLSAYMEGTYICIFFKKLIESRKKSTIKIKYDKSFPLYREDNTYELTELYEFYYKFTADIAQKFDRRNGADTFMKKLDREVASA